ncbi:MAG: PKD domain-containing protein, partial [Saprospiraceae bacterium]|nr:PKD domain-containing protein [Saprospiraceae bacterium]
LDGPEGEFSFTTDNTCLPVTAFFIGTSLDLYDYIWDFGDGLLDSSETRVIADTVSHLYEIPGAYVPRLILIDTENCLRSFTSDTIDVLDAVPAEVSAPPYICIGDTLQLVATLEKIVDGLSYTWSGTVACDTCLITSAVPDSTMMYQFVTTHPSGCTAGDSVIVEVKPLPGIEAFSLDSLTCYDENVRLSVTTDPGVTIQWELPPGASCTDCPEPELPPGSEGAFAVTVIDSFGCDAYDTAVVLIFLDTVDFLIPDKTICLGDTTSVSVNGVQNPVWSGSTQLSCSACPAPLIYPDEDVTITVAAVHPVGCRVRDTIQISVLSQDMINAGDDQEICAGEMIELIGMTPGDGGSWEPASMIVGPNGVEVTVAPDTTEIFVLTSVRDECILSDSLEVRVLYKTSISATGDMICPGDTALLSATGDAEIYQWFTDSGMPVGSDTTGALSMHTTESLSLYVVGYRSVCEPDTAG